MEGGRLEAIRSRRARITIEQRDRWRDHRRKYALKHQLTKFNGKRLTPHSLRPCQEPAEVWLRQRIRVMKRQGKRLCLGPVEGTPADRGLSGEFPSAAIQSPDMHTGESLPF
jgi:hypothetical protein